MTDVCEPKARRYIMSQIRKDDTKPDPIVNKFLFENGFRYRIQDNTIIGNPDIDLRD
jgi:DNA mismatch endonuclease (patch repair protein)